MGGGWQDLCWKALIPGVRCECLLLKGWKGCRGGVFLTSLAELRRTGVLEHYDDYAYGG